MDIPSLLNELQFKAIRSSGAGGQHVNKVSSKIELTFDVANSISLKQEEKELLYKSLETKLSKNNTLVLFCDETRSQHQNKEIAIERFFELLKKGLTKPKVRKSTKPTKASIKKRLKSKKRLSEKKDARKKTNLD